MKKKILLFTVTLISLFSVFNFSAYGMEYGNTFPNYAEFTGGCYCEVKSSVGTVALIFPSEYKSGSFGFYGVSGFNICNCTDSTIYGRAVFPSGDEYYLRFQSFGTAEISRANVYNQYEYLTIFEILNTNIDFTDNSEADRQTDPIFKEYDFNYKEQFYISFAAVALFVLVASFVIGGSKK